MTHKEIGSEFWNIPVSARKNHLPVQNEKWFISGTAALEYILDDILSQKKIKSAALPSWCCCSLIIPFERRGIKVSFYPVLIAEGKFTISFDTVKSDVLLIMDFFGYGQNTRAPAGYEGVVIRDLTHSVFRTKYEDADYYFGSLRKWAGFWTGGFATAEKWNGDKKVPAASEDYVKLRRSAMNDKLDYLNGKSESKSYLEVFEKCDEFLLECPVMAADSRDIDAASKLDVQFLKSARRRNAGILLEELAEYAVFPLIGEDDCPLFVPIIVPDGKRNELRKFLISKEIYCPVHWPVTEYHVLDETEKIIYENELSIICDQRYDDEDMSRILEEIRKFF